MIKVIEVEVRSFIDEQEYEWLLQFLNNNAKFVEKDFQVTVYFKGLDLRVQRASNSSKLWFKGGRIHDIAREEVEVKFAQEDFEKLIKLLRSLGFDVEVVWIRHRLVFILEGVKVCLDDTEGYGKIVELEHCSNAGEDFERIEKMLVEKLRKLGIKATERKEFEEKFAWYKQNWRDLIGKKIKELNLEFLLQ